MSAHNRSDSGRGPATIENSGPGPGYGKISRFGQFEDTGIGPDLTLEWDSTDPDLHALTGESSTPALTVTVQPGMPDWYDPERGIPDA